MTRVLLPRLGVALTVALSFRRRSSFRLLPASTLVFHFVGWVLSYRLRSLQLVYERSTFLTKAGYTHND